MIDCLEIGKYYKSIKDMCAVTELVYKDSSNSRKANLKQIERYYLLEKEGRGFWAREKYIAPKEKIDNRKNNGGHVTTTKYETLLDTLLMDWLVDVNIRGNAITTRNQLFIDNDEVINIPLFREGYKELLNMGYEEYSKKQGMSKGLVLTYSQKVRKIVETSLETVLNRLQKQNIIKWQKNIMVKFYSTYELEIADAELETEIIKAERDTYEKLKITPFERVNPKVNKKFMTAVCSNFNDISSYWRVYNIDILNYEVIKSSLLDDQQRIEITNELIIRYIQSTVESVQNKKHENSDGEQYKPYANEKYVSDINKLNRLIWLVPEGYKTESEELIEAFAPFGDINIDFDTVNADW